MNAGSVIDPARFAFDPEQGITIREPPGRGYGFWVGGAKAFYDEPSGKFYLFYRQRTPLEQGRGGHCAVAESDDGVTFRDVWWARKEELAANSIEVGQPLRDPSGEWRLYLSYEYAHSGRWRVDVLRGPSPDAFDAQGRRTVLLPEDFGVGFLKDPVVYLDGGRYRLYACASPRQRSSQDAEGVIRTLGHEATLLFESDDGFYFTEARYVFEPTGRGWDGAKARLNAVIPVGRGYVAYYDGARSYYDNYEEWCGLASSPDGVRFTRLTPDGPLLRSPHGCVRYVYGLPAGDRLYCYYEYTRPDLSHELRVSVLEFD